MMSYVTLRCMTQVTQFWFKSKCSSFIIFFCVTMYNWKSRLTAIHIEFYGHSMIFWKFLMTEVKAVCVHKATSCKSLFQVQCRWKKIRNAFLNNRYYDALGLYWCRQIFCKFLKAMKIVFNFFNSGSIERKSLCSTRKKVKKSLILK